MARAKARGGWSYSTGERGRNRVRVFERPDRSGEMLLQYAERDVTGRLRQVRQSLGAISRAGAKTKADELAALHATLGPSTAKAPLTLQTLFDSYGREVTPHKGAQARSHDRMCREMFLRYFGAARSPATLSRRDWDRFVHDRRRGTIGPKHGLKGRAVRDRPVQQNLAHLMAVLNWATMAGDGTGGVLLERNPLKGLPLPKEESPKRPVVTTEQYETLQKAAARRGPVMQLALMLCHDTGHRIGSVRHLRWSDVDLERRTIHWRGEYDKLGRDHTTPLTDELVAALSKVQKSQATIGDTWIFKAPDGKRHWSYAAAGRKWAWMAKKAGLPKDQRYGWHALRRQFATELKHIPLKDLCALGGWTDSGTVLTCYQQPDECTQRAALSQRKLLQAGGLK